MNTLLIKEIKKSIDLMDEFEDGDYDYLELEHWFWAKDRKDRECSFTDNTGKYYISLMISKNCDKSKSVCKNEPTMTKLRQMQHHGISLDENYEEDSIDAILKEACTKWEKDVFIELSMNICVNAQTSWNRMDYGCEWLGGGDWEEKTLYGETTDFYITGIILREPFKSIAQEAREIVAELHTRYDENKEFIEKVMIAFKHIEQPVIHEKYGEGASLSYLIIRCVYSLMIEKVYLYALMEFYKDILVFP